MKREQAEMLVAVLSGAWPRAEWPDTTMRLYRAELERLDDIDVASGVVHAAVRSSEWPPTIASLLADYKQASRRKLEAAAARALPPPPLTDEERAEGARRMRELLARLETSIAMNRRRTS